MSKNTGFILIGIGLVGLIAYLAMRGSTKATPTNNGLGISLDLSKIGSLFGGSKPGAAGAPTVVPNEGTYYTGNSSVTGNTLTGSSGQTLVYGTD